MRCRNIIVLLWARLVMHAGLVIIVERRGHRWVAWINAFPKGGVYGKSVEEALRKLFERVNGQEFDKNRLVAREEFTRDGHLEFVLPIRMRPIPKPSQN